MADPNDNDAQPNGFADYGRRLWQIESSNNPYNVTGSNRGKSQFGPEEERRYGINDSNRYDDAAQAAALQREYAAHRPGLSRALGRDPTFGEFYVGHQQGPAGGPALLNPANASLPAWQVIRPYYKSDYMAQQAIRGNDGGRGSPLHNLGINDISAAGMTSYWKDKFESGMRSSGSLPSVPSSTPIHPMAAAFNRPA